MTILARLVSAVAAVAGLVAVPAAGLVGLVAMPAAAMASGCFPIAWQPTGPRLTLASVDMRSAEMGPAVIGTPDAGMVLAALPKGTSIRLTFLGHSSFLIETPDGVTAVTDYNGFTGAPLLPDIVTMNNAHSSHYTDVIDPGIRHVMRGWNPAGGWSDWDVQELDLRVRNIPTAVHGRGGDQALSNSIFVFETPELCVAHLGHLHHRLTDEQVAELGQIDILLVPIDGIWTMSHAEMREVIEQIRPSLVIPMHYFNDEVLGRFSAVMEGGWEMRASPTPTITLSRATLPYRQVLVLPGS